MGLRKILCRLRLKPPSATQPETSNSDPPPTEDQDQQDRKQEQRTIVHLPGCCALPNESRHSLFCCEDLQMSGSEFDKGPNYKSYFDTILAYLHDMSRASEDTTEIPKTRHQICAFRLRKILRRKHVLDLPEEQVWHFRVSECERGRFFEQIVGEEDLRRLFDGVEVPGDRNAGVQRRLLTCEKHREWSFEVLMKVMKGGFGDEAK